MSSTATSTKFIQHLVLDDTRLAGSIREYHERKLANTVDLKTSKNPTSREKIRENLLPSLSQSASPVILIFDNATTEPLFKALDDIISAKTPTDDFPAVRLVNTSGQVPDRGNSNIPWFTLKRLSELVEARKEPDSKPGADDLIVGEHIGSIGAEAAKNLDALYENPPEA